MSFFFFNDTATTEIYTLSLHDALPICLRIADRMLHFARRIPRRVEDRHVIRALLGRPVKLAVGVDRSEEHTSELQSRLHLVCRLLLEKKKCRRGIVMSKVNKRSGDRPA